jgi:hypothetical protein
MHTLVSCHLATPLAVAVLFSTLSPTTHAAQLPDADQRAGPPKTLNTLRAFPEIPSKKEWQARAREIREHILVSIG